MKKLIFYSAIICLLSSCKTYQLSTVSSTDAPVDSTGVFKIENDSLALSYSFNGEDEPIHIEIFNKLNEPLYINWAHSALISSDRAYSYAANEIKIQGSTSSSSTASANRRNTYTEGSISATAKLSTQESFIPPNAKINKTIYILKQLESAKPAQPDLKKTALNYDDGSGQASAKRAYFTADNSPLKFKSYVSLYTVKENVPKPFSLQQEFYISGIVKTGTNPNNLYEFKRKRGDVIYKEKATAYAKSIAIIGVIGAAGALSAADQSLNEKDQEK